MLDAMPLFQIEAGTSESFTRMSVYAGLAFGSRGLYYYFWGGGALWEWDDGVGKPSPNYPIAKEANADAVVWGKLLLSTKNIGTLTTGPCDGRHCMHPSTGACNLQTPSACMSACVQIYAV